MAATIGYVNVIKRSGKDGSRFPLTEDCLIGSGLHCDIRIHLDNVATEHCLIKCQEGGKCLLMNLDKQMTTKLNNNHVTEKAMLQHGDIISVSDRLFRWEYEELPRISSVTKPTVTLLSHNMTDDTGSSKRLVAVVSPQIRERHDTSQSLRTWVLRRSVGNTLSSRSRQHTRTAEDRRSTSLVKIYAQDSDESAVPDNKTPQSVNLSRRASVASAVKKSLLKVTPHLRKSGGVSTVETITSDTPVNVKSAVRGSVPALVETPVSKTPRLKNSRVSYTVTPRSRKSNITQMGKRSHSMATLTKTPNAEESVDVSSPRRSYRIDAVEDSSSVKSTNATQIETFIGEQTAQFSEVQSVQDSDQSAVLDKKTPQSANISRRKSVKSTGKKSLLSVTPHLQKSEGVSSVETTGSQTPLTIKSAVRGSVPDLMDVQVSKTPRLMRSRVSYSVTPRSRKSNITQIGKRSHSMVPLKTTPNTEESAAIASPRRVSSSGKSTHATPDVKYFEEQTTVQSPDLFSSGQVSVNREMVTLKELQKQTPALSERPKRKSAGLLLAHIRESQESFSRGRRNSTPSANAKKINTRSVRASMVMPKKSKLSFTPLSQSKTPRTLKTLRAMSAKAAKRRLTDVDLSEIAANKLKAETPKTPDKKKMAAILQCHKPRMLFSEVLKKTPVKKNVVAKLPSVPIIRRKKVPKKPKVHTPRKPPVKGINSTGHVDSPETIIIHGKQSMALRRPIQKIKDDGESLKITTTSANLEQTKGIETSVSVQESSRAINTRKSVSFSPAPQVVAFAASRRISTRKSLKIPNISEEIRGTLSPNSESSILEIQPNRKTSILKKPSLAEARAEVMEINTNSTVVTNLESVHSRSSVASSTPVRVSERQKGRTSSHSPSTPRMAAKIGKSSSQVSVTHQSPEVLNTSIVSQASSTFDFDAVTTPCISVEKLVSPLNTTSSKKQTNNDSGKRNVNISAQQIFKDLVADKIIDSSKWLDPDVNVATNASQWTESEALNMSSGKKSDRRSVSFPVNHYSTRKSQGKRISGEMYATSNKTVPSLQNKLSVSLSKETCTDVNELDQLSGTTLEESPKLDRNSGGGFHRKSKSQQSDIGDAKNNLRSKKSLSDDASLSEGNVNQQSLSVRQRRSTINALTEVRGIRRLFDVTKKQGSPLNDLTDVTGVKQLLKSPKQQKSPKNDLTDVRGVRKLLKTPSIQKSPQNDLTDVRGVKRLLRSSLKRKSPKNDLTDVRGVKRLLKSPLKQQKSPQNDLTDVRGLKRLFRSTEKQASPKNDLTGVRGVRRLLQSPKPNKSPQNDLTDVRGVKQLLEPPQPQKSPYNDLTDVRGVKQILGSPRQQKSPANDLTDVRGVKDLFRSTRKRSFPENDLTDVRGVKQLLRSPLQQKSPYNDLRDVRGVKNLFRSTERLTSPKNDLSDVVGVSSLFNSPQVVNKSPSVLKQEVSLPVRELKDNAVKATQANENVIEEKEPTVLLGAKRRKYNPKGKETSTSSETVVSVNSYSTRGKRAKKDFSNQPSGADSHDTDKVKTLSDKLSRENVLPSDEVQPQSHKNINPPRTRRGKGKVTAEDTSVSDDIMLNSVKRNDLEQKDVLTLSITGHELPSITNSPRTRRTRKQAVAEVVINSNLAPSSESTSSPRTLRGKKGTITVSKTSEEVESRSVVETDKSIKLLETKELFVPPSAIPSVDTVPSPRTRRGRKQTVKNQKVEGEISQVPDELQKPEKDELTKTSQFGSTGTVSPLKTRRGKKYVEKNRELSEELESGSRSNKLQPEVETQNLPRNSQSDIQSGSDSGRALLNEAGSPKIRGGMKGNVAKQQRNKAIASVTDKNTSESRESDTASIKPQQKRVNFADIIQVSSPSNNSSPRTCRGKKQVLPNDEHSPRANNQLVSDEQEKTLGTHNRRKVVNAPSVECSPQSVVDQARTRRGRKIHTADKSEELKLPLNSDKTGEATATEKLKQNKVSNDADGVVFVDPSTVSPLKPRKGRKAGTKEVPLTADIKEKTGVNKNLENNVATVAAPTLGKSSVKSNTADVADVISSKRTLRGKKENDTQDIVTTGVPTDTSESEERKGVRSTRTGRKRAVNSESETSAPSTDKGSSKDTGIDSSPPKRSQRGRIRADKEERKRSPVSQRTQTETDSTSDSIENRLHGETQRTRQTTASSASKIVCHPNEVGEEKTSSRRPAVRQHKKETNKNDELEQVQSTGETVQRSTRSKRKQVQETDEGSPKKKKRTQTERLLDTSPEPKVTSPRPTRQRRNRCT